MKTHSLSIHALILIAVALSCFNPINAADYESEEFQAAYQQYLAVSGDEGGSAKKLAQQWQDIYADDMNDPLALVLLGSSHTLMGRDALMPWSKMNHTEKGLDEMSLAVRLLQDQHKTQLFEQMPVYLHVKTTAAITFSQVPEFFGRHEDGYYLFEDVLSDPVFLAMPVQAQTYVYYYAIAAALQVDKSEQAAQWQTDLAAKGFSDDYTAAAAELE